MECADPGPMLDFLQGEISDRKMRPFNCACCRRVWHLVPDDRGRLAVGAAERYADGVLRSDEFAWFRDATHDAFLDAKNAEYHAEAAADFCYTADYDAVCASLFAAAAIRAAMSDRADRGIDLLDAYRRDESLWDPGHEPRRGGPAWAAAAADKAARVRVYAARGARGNDQIPLEVLEAADLEGEATRRVEAEAQVHLLRDLVGNQFRPASLDFASLPPGVVLHARAAFDERSLPTGSLNHDRLSILADALEEAGCTNADILSHLRGSGPHVRGCWAVDLLLGKE